MTVLDLIIRHEGFRAQAYCDRCGQPLLLVDRVWHCGCARKGKTPGCITVGIGTCVDGAGITLAEARVLAQTRLQSIVGKLGFVPSFDALSPARQAALCDMAYTMGLHGLLMFTAMWECLKQYDFDGAADAVLNSKWALEASTRARETSAMIRTGEWPAGKSGAAVAG